MAEKINERGTKEMYISDMVSYSIIVNKRRAFAEIKDGLKPVQRRVLYDMMQQNAVSNHLKKSAKITGDTMGLFHPHGDSSIYACMEPLANWWKCKCPLIKPHGSFGTIMGDKPAAARYTEAGLSEFAEDCYMNELREAKFIIDWQDNYDRTTKEPEFLPAKVPILLINGSYGIGLGLSTNIPSHNLVEVLEATRTLLRDPNSNVVLVPDHCQSLQIFNADWKKINDTGYGNYTVRGIVEVREERGYPVIHILSLPERVSTQDIVDTLMEMANKKQLPMVKDIIDGSKSTVDIQIVLKKGADPAYVVELLYSKTAVQSNQTVNFQCVDNIYSVRLSYREYLLKFIKFRETIKFRLYCNKYKTSATRCHKLETYIKFIESGIIDDVVKMLKKQKTTNSEELQELLIKKLNITDIQAGFILTTNLQQLTKGYLDKYKAEYKDLSEKMMFFKKAITDDGSIIRKEIDDELVYMESKYGEPRKCPIIDSSELSSVPKGTFKVIITEKNFIRKIPDNDKIGVVRGDQPKFVLRVDNTENIILFDNKGKVFKLPIAKIPVTDKSGVGTDVRILVKNLTANIISVCYEPMIINAVNSGLKHYVVTLTKSNIIKKLDIEDFLNINSSGLVYTKLKDDDTVVGVSIVSSNLDVVVYSKQKALRMHLNDIPLLKRNAVGNKAMNTDCELEGLSIIYPDTQSIVVVTANGKMNKFPAACLASHGRGKAGNNVIKLDTNDSILELYGACESDIIKVYTTEGVQDVPVMNIKSKSGIAVGQKVLSVKGNIIKSEIVYVR